MTSTTTARNRAVVSSVRKSADDGGRDRMHRGRRGHPCEPDLSRMGLWTCPDCGQQWEVHGIAGTDVRARRVSRLAWFFVKLLG